MRNKGNTDKACPICRHENYDQKPFVEGQKYYLVAIVTTIQAYARGMNQRNAFYQQMKDLSYKPANEDIRKRFIGWKLQ